MISLELQRKIDLVRAGFDEPHPLESLASGQANVNARQVPLIVTGQGDYARSYTPKLPRPCDSYRFDPPYPAAPKGPRRSTWALFWLVVVLASSAVYVVVVLGV